MTARRETERVRRHYDRNAESYDQLIDPFERVLFGGGREWVCSRAQGEVLEIAAGTGRNLPFYPEGVRLVGVELSPGMLEIARRRAQELGVQAELRVGDAHNLPFPDASFDVVLSTIGVMFAPDQQKAAGELLRVLRPGGKIGMANWVPDGYVGDFFRTIGRHVPPPTGLKAPFVWGTEEGLRELFGDGLGSLHAAGRLALHAVSEFPLARAADAHRELESGRIQGRVVLVP